VRVFPPPPPAVSPIEGLIDFHNHCAPDVFGRAVDADEMAQLYLARKIEAVQWMWRMQGGYGRVVWLPTFDADNHVKHFKDAPEGIKAVGADGKALPALREVAKICAQQKLVLCTGHASPSEA